MESEGIKILGVAIYFQGIIQERILSELHSVSYNARIKKIVYCYRKGEKKFDSVG